MKDIKKIQKEFIENMKLVAEELNKPAAEITKAQFFSNSPKDFSEWDIRKAGGFDGMKKSFFSNDVEGLEYKYGGRAIKKFQNKLEKKYGEELFFRNELIASLKETIKNQPITFHKPTKQKKKKTKKSRTIVAKISDTHFGANISEEEMNGVNAFNWIIASRRLATFCEQIANYKIQYRENTDLVIQLNGDIIAGQIHNQEWFVDLLTDQFAGTLHILGQAISYLATHFDNIKVVCTPGNHGRNVGKADKGRATTHKWDSYENMIYIALREMMHREWSSGIEFIIPESPFALYQIQGHWCLQTHGDTVINVGNPGKNISMSSISEQVNKFNASDMLKPGNKVDILCVGHVHVPTAQLLDNGCMAMINGCLSGTDPFAQSIGIFSSNPTQFMFETTKEHAVGDMRMIQVKEADNKSYLDKIIKPYVRNT